MSGNQNADGTSGLPDSSRRAETCSTFHKGFGSLSWVCRQHIDARDDTVNFTMAYVLRAGEAAGDVTERTCRPYPIREKITAQC